MNKNLSLKKTVFWKFAGHASRYGIVGIIGTILHIGTLAILVERFHQNPVLSSVIGFVFALIVSYLLNFFWVFSSNSDHPVAGFRYIIVSIFGLTLSTIIMHISVNTLQLQYEWGALGIILAVPPINFLLNYLWTFSAHETSGETRLKRHN